MSNGDQKSTETSPKPSYWQRCKKRLRSISSQRLDQELSVFEVKLDGLIEEQKQNDDLPHKWDEYSKKCVKLAKQALEDGEPDKGWHLLNAAKRFRLYGLEGEILAGEAKQVLEEAKDESKRVTPWRRESIRHLLADDQGKPEQKKDPDVEGEPEQKKDLDAEGEPEQKKALNADKVVMAAELLHEHHSNTYRKQAIVRRRLWLLCGVSVVALGAWIALAPRLPSLNQWTVGRCWWGLRLFWLSLVLAGVVGAILSGFTSTIAKGVAKTRIPEELLASVITFSRLVVGAMSAVAIAVFLGSGVLSFEPLSYELLLAIALVSGFTERLLVRAVESTVEAV